MAESPAPRRLSRRTVAQGVAWAVPAVAVAVPATAAAASGETPPPVINFGGACGNTGALQKGCGGFKTLQVPLTLTNLSAVPIFFQITSMFTCNCATAPMAAGPGVAVGVRGIFKTPSHAVANQDNCTVVASNIPPAPTCPGGVPDGTILVPAGTNAGTYWIESTSNDDSSSFSTRISYRLLNADCSVILTDTAFTTSAISPLNCNG